MKKSNSVILDNNKRLKVKYGKFSVGSLIEQSNIINKKGSCVEYDEGETMLEIQYELERRKINYDFDDNGNIFLIKVG